MSCLLSLGTKDSDNTPIMQNILGHKKTGRPRNLPQIQLGLNTIANKKSK